MYAATICDQIEILKRLARKLEYGGVVRDWDISSIQRVIVTLKQVGDVANVGRLKKEISSLKDECYRLRRKSTCVERNDQEYTVEYQRNTIIKLRFRLLKEIKSRNQLRRALVCDATNVECLRKEISSLKAKCYRLQHELICEEGGNERTIKNLKQQVVELKAKLYDRLPKTQGTF